MYFIKVSIVLFLCCLIIIIHKGFMVFVKSERKTEDGSLS
jgi:hypothetical protein